MQAQDPWLLAVSVGSCGNRSKTDLRTVPLLGTFSPVPVVRRASIICRCQNSEALLCSSRRGLFMMRSLPVPKLENNPCVRIRRGLIADKSYAGAKTRSFLCARADAACPCPNLCRCQTRKHSLCSSRRGMSIFKSLPVPKLGNNPCVRVRRGLMADKILCRCHNPEARLVPEWTRLVQILCSNP